MKYKQPERNKFCVVDTFHPLNKLLNKRSKRLARRRLQSKYVGRLVTGVPACFDWYLRTRVLVHSHSMHSARHAVWKGAVVFNRKHTPMFPWQTERF